MKRQKTFLLASIFAGLYANTASGQTPAAISPIESEEARAADSKAISFHQLTEGFGRMLPSEQPAIHEAKGKKPPPPPPPPDGNLPLTSSAWTLTGYTIKAATLAVTKDINIPLFNVNGALAFNFPEYVGGSTFNTANYLTTSGSPAFAHALSDAATSVTPKYLNILVAVPYNGNPIFQYKTESGNTCVYDAHARPFIWSSSTLGADGEFSRWWANPIAYDLSTGPYQLPPFISSSTPGVYSYTPGQAIIVVALSPDQWSSVNGKFGNSSPEAQADFVTALQNLRSIGSTYGGGCFFGHGDFLTGGTAQFQILSYSIQ